MAAKDFISSGRIVHALSPASVGTGAAITGSSIDRKGWRWAVITLHLGTVGATANGTVNVQRSADGSTGWENIPGCTFTILPTHDDRVLIGSLDLEQGQRYIRVNGTAGTGGSTLIGASVALYGTVNSAEYIARGSGEADELQFQQLFANATS